MIIPEKDDYSILGMVFMLFLLSLVGKTEFENFWLTRQTHREGWVEGAGSECCHRLTRLFWVSVIRVCKGGLSCVLSQLRWLQQNTLDRVACTGDIYFSQFWRLRSLRSADLALGDSPSP